MYKTLLYDYRPENVPEGANIQWEVELLEFKMPKVISKTLFYFSVKRDFDT
jgi:hypothetical protein